MNFKSDNDHRDPDDDDFNTEAYTPPTSDDNDNDEIPEITYMEDQEYDEDDVPYRLPRVEDTPFPLPAPKKPDVGSLTMPHFNEPGTSDPRETLLSSKEVSQDTLNHYSPDLTQPGSNQSTVPAPPAQTLYSPAVNMPPNQPNQAASPYQQIQPAQPQAPQRGYIPPVPAGAGHSGQAPPRRKKATKILGLPSGCVWVFFGLMLTICGGFTLISATLAIIFVPRIEEQWSSSIAAVDDYEQFQTTFIYDREGGKLWESFGEGRREVVPYDRFPKHLINATVAIEDGSFWNNPGIDMAATTVAFLKFVGADAGEDTPGGSTITQQLVRNVLFDFQKRSERSAQRKIEEIILALLLNQRKSKEDVITLYLNEIYYGNLAYGAQTASQTFFGKNVQDITLGEAALLAGLPQAPADLDPLSPDPYVQAAVEARWRLVLQEMVEDNYITQSEMDAAITQGIIFVSPDVKMEAPHFTVYAQNELERLMLTLGYSAEDIARGGLKVYTTIDQNINKMAQSIAADQVASLAGQNVSNAAVIILKPFTGEILGMVGSVNYNSDTIDGRVNVTTALRQPGSAVKPFTYAAALERGMTAGDVIWDVPIEIGIPGQPAYIPRNYDGAFHGPMTLRTALANSYNIPAVQTLRLVGVDYLLAILRRFGVTTLSEDASQYGLSLTLGGGEVSLLELTNAFAVFANQGRFVEPTTILCVIDNEDNIIYQYENSCPSGRLTDQSVDRHATGLQVLDPRISYLITDVIGDNVARSAAMGSNSPLRTDGIASSVKTGTTNDYKDNWTVGYTSNVAIGVWVGNNNGDPMINSSGLTGAAPIWNQIITTIYNDPAYKSRLLISGQFLPDKPAAPSGMSQQQICDVRRLTDPSTSCPALMTEWLLDSPAGIPDGAGNLQYPPGQAINQNQRPQYGTYVELASPGVYKTLAYPLPDEVAAGVQFQLQPGDRQPLPPKYCRVPLEIAQDAVNRGARELFFIALPTTSQSDAVSAERYARERNLAVLPNIDCWLEAFTAQSQFGPVVTTAVINSPTAGQIISSGTPIIGTVQFSPDQAKFYKIEILGGPFPDWTTLGDVHYENVSNGQLEWLAAEGLPPGNYQIRLAIVDHNSGYLQQPYSVPFTVQ